MKPTWLEKLRYRFDNFMAKGTIALIGGLGTLSLVVILLIALIVSIAGIAPGNGERVSFIEAVWMSLMRTLDAGTMGSDEGWPFRIAMFAVTLGGVFIISTLIGVLTSGIDTKLEELRKGRSRVLENDHTVILGWSAQIFTILSELIIANENRKNACIVVLGSRDKVDMEDEIHSAIGDLKNTRIVCRSGNPIDMNDLQLVSLQTSRSIIILSGDYSDPDAQVIKIILAITNNSQRRTAPYHIVAQIDDPKNMDVARMVGKDEVELILSGNIISRIIAQTCRQSGLSVVYTELLDFKGDEIYFKEEAALVGKTFAEILALYKKSSVLGLFTPGVGSRLNPPMNTRIQPGDQVIAISEDDDTILLDPPAGPVVNDIDIARATPVQSITEKTLILGWNSNALTIITELDKYMVPGSEGTLVADFEHGEEEIRRLRPMLQNLEITFRQGDTTDRQVLDELNPQHYNHVIVLAYSESKELQEADACTLITLLHLRDMALRLGKAFSIVSQMLDVQNRVLAEVTQADDFIVSNRLISLVMTQVSENKYLNAVFADIFDAAGSEIYLKPAEEYVLIGKPVNFYTVIESAARRGEVAFGYRLKAQEKDSSKDYGITVNPDKSAMVTFSSRDCIVVLAER